MFIPNQSNPLITFIEPLIDSDVFFIFLFPYVPSGVFFMHISINEKVKSLLSRVLINRQIPDNWAPAFQGKLQSRLSKNSFIVSSVFGNES